MKKAKDIMSSKVHTLAPSDTLAEAAKQLASQNVGSMPIVDKDVCTGIITDRDIVVAGVAKGKDVTTTTVAEIATGNVITVQADDDAKKVADLMAKHQVRRAPVLEGTKLVGMISQADVAKTLGADDTGEMVESISR